MQTMFCFEILLEEKYNIVLAYYSLVTVHFVKIPSVGIKKTINVKTKALPRAFGLIIMFKAQFKIIYLIRITHKYRVIINITTR